MDDRPGLERAREHAEQLRYPVTRADAAIAFEDVTIPVGEGDADRNLGRLVSDVGSDAFQSPEELVAELREALPAPLDDE